MFEIAELGQQLSKKDYKQRVPELRTRLLEAQQQLQDSNFPVLVLISGVDGGGKGQIINLLNEWMDPRGIQTHAFGLPTEDQRSRPEFWRYWMALPPRGQVSIFVGSWYSSPIADRVSKKIDNSALDERLIHINNVERELTDDGMLIIKCWIHMGKEQQQKRLHSFQKDPDSRWRVTKKDIKHLKLYDKFVGIAERVIRETSTGHCPWLIVDGSDIKHSSVTVGEHILARINTHLAQREHKITTPPAPAPDTITQVQSKGLLQSLDMTRSLSKSEYKSKLEKYQGQLNLLAREARTR
ncbi:MAG: polyphosphate:AMP phosphotransferase, partial [Gammaproteobacteria bacterium]